MNVRTVLTAATLLTVASFAQAQPTPTHWVRNVELVDVGVKGEYGLGLKIVEGVAPGVKVNHETLTIEVTRGALLALDAAAKGSKDPGQARRMALGRLVEETAGMVRSIEPGNHPEGIYRGGLVDRILKGEEAQTQRRTTHNYKTEITTLNAGLKVHDASLRVVDGARPTVAFQDGELRISRGVLATIDAEAARSAEPKVFRRKALASLVREATQTGLRSEMPSSREIWKQGVEEIAKTGKTPPKLLEPTWLHKWGRPDYSYWNAKAKPGGLQHSPEGWKEILRTVDTGLRIEYEMSLRVVPIRSSNNDRLQLRQGGVIEVSEAWLRRNGPNAQTFIEAVAQRAAGYKYHPDLEPIKAEALRNHITYQGTLRQLTPNWRSLPVIPWNGMIKDLQEPQRRYANRDAYEAYLRTNYRKPNGTMDYARLRRDKVFKEVGGFARFGMALFLKEVAAVAATGDRRQIDQFFDYLLSTDFYKHYGLFVAGARLSEVAYTKFLQTHIRPKFVNGLLKTNLVLAAGMALPLIVEGQFEGRAFVISLASLGLSSFAVQGAVRGLGWVMDIKKAQQTGALATVGKGASRLARMGGWFYTVAELAVILYVAEELDELATDYFDRRKARGELADAGEAFLDALQRADATPDGAREAIDAYHDAWSGYRNFLYRPLEKEEAIFAQQMAKLARRAKILADRRTQMVRRLAGQEALRLRAIADHGSVEKYAEHLAAKDAAALNADANAEFKDYVAGRDELLETVYKTPRRSSTFLDGVDDLPWHLRGAAQGIAGDPYAGSLPIYARFGRSRSRAAFRAALEGVSDNRLQAYDDEAELLKALADNLDADDRGDLAAVVRAKHRIVLLTRAADRDLANGKSLIDTAGLGAKVETATGE